MSNLRSTSQELLFQMLRIRAIEETIAARYSEQKMRCPVHLSIGQEAVSASVALAIRSDDFAVSTHRAHGHYLGKGGNLRRMIAEIYGKVTGCARGKGGSMHLIDESVGFMGSTAIVGNTIPVGVGLGLSIQLKKTDQISCVFLGDGAVEEGAFYEAANFAALRKLPVLFICENNFYSVYSPLGVRQPAGRSIAKLAQAIGLESQAIDENNAEAVLVAMQESAEDVRAGKGPRFIEYTNYRYREHCGPNYDNDIGYRTEEEYQSWLAKDPIQTLERKLLSRKEVSENLLSHWQTQIQEEIVSAFEFAEQSPFPEEEETYKDLFA